MRLFFLLLFSISLLACKDEAKESANTSPTDWNQKLAGTWTSQRELFILSEDGFYKNRAANGVTDYGEYNYDGEEFSLQVFTHKHEGKINPTFKVLSHTPDTFKLSNGQNSWYYLRSNRNQLSKKAYETVWTKRHEYHIYGTWKSERGETLIFDDFGIMQHSTVDSTYIGCYAILGNVINFECKSADVNNFYRIEIEPSQNLSLTHINTNTSKKYQYISEPVWTNENKRIAAPYAIDSPEKRIFFFKNKARIGRLVEVY